MLAFNSVTDKKGTHGQARKIILVHPGSESMQTIAAVAFLAVIPLVMPAIGARRHIMDRGDGVTLASGKRPTA